MILAPAYRRAAPMEPGGGINVLDRVTDGTAPTEPGKLLNIRILAGSRGAPPSVGKWNRICNVSSGGAPKPANFY